MRTRSALFIGIMLLCLATCSREGATNFKLFSFPPWSVPHAEGWDYWGSIEWYEPDAGGALSDVSMKVVDINDNVLLSENFGIAILANEIDPCVRWDNFDTLCIMFSKCRNVGCCEDSGAVHFIDRVYLYDSADVRFYLTPYHSDDVQ